ncbi:ChaN family lipoprotein [Vibrio fluvialis]|uniref:ChaN family lipoprotein n=1 Tax=Vibrio fluvialis TaxID=676 RepID=UPI000509C66E|nr:ChaN family lipoprotein [Vibrio fluvialis]MBY7896290.1 ChaN family lipoprotein [Vibrio fluvialis]MBY7995587.1 ChaN family lipoprotein [Vibrio fluvialis]
MRFALPLLLSASLMGCAATPQVTTYYDYQLASPKGNSLTLSQFTQNIRDADVILVGEWHTHAGIHRFQTELLQELSKSERPVALSMEQFSRPDQALVDAYLRGEIGEQYLIQQTSAWLNYESDYRPLIELAKQQKIAVIAANAPKSVVRCIGRYGAAYLDQLTPDERLQVAAQINTQDSVYKQQFMASMHHGTPQQTENQFAAQITWDETMAESIVNYLTKHPGARVMHIAGLFHTQNGLGTAASILRRNPSLNIVVVTPVSDWQTEGQDYQLRVLAPPVRYVQTEHQMEAFKQLTHRNADLTCKLLNND